MKKLQDRLREDADDHRDTAHQFDMRPQATVNWQHALNCTEAADTLDRAEQITIPLATLAQLVVALEVSKRWHNGDKYRYGKPQQRQAWTAQSGELDTAITAGRAAIDSAELAEPMIEVADRYAHRLALELECVLADRPGYYDKAMQVLGEYRSAMNAIHERHSPTFMGEPLIHADHHGPDWTQRDGEKDGMATD